MKKWCSLICLMMCAMYTSFTYASEQTRLHSAQLHHPIYTGIVTGISAGLIRVDSPTKRDLHGDGIAMPQAYVEHVLHHNQMAHFFGVIIGFLLLCSILVALKSCYNRCVS